MMNQESKLEQEQEYKTLVGDSDLKDISFALFLSLPSARKDEALQSRHITLAASGRLNQLWKNSQSEKQNPVTVLETLCGCMLNASEKNALFKPQFAGDREQLSLGLMSKEDGKKLRIRLSSFLRTYSRSNLRSNDGYIFDGEIVQGGARSLLLKAVTPIGKPVVAKAYSLADETQASLEFAVSEKVHSSFDCPFLIQVTRLVSTERHRILILPILPISFAEIIASDPGNGLPESLCVRYGCQILCAIEALHLAGYAHCDVKPENIMINTDGNAVLIDLGSCVQLEKKVTESTPPHFLDSPDIACLERDVACLCSTLICATLGGPHSCFTKRNLFTFAKSLPSARFTARLLASFQDGPPVFDDLWRAVSEFSVIVRPQPKDR